MQNLNIKTKDHLKNIVENLINNNQIIDIHTHLFPPQHSIFFKSGFVDLLTYHYLTTELLSMGNIQPSKFFSQTKYDQAEIIWNELFIKRIPISEACKGIITILCELNINLKNPNFKFIFKEVNDNLPSDLKIFSSLNLEKVIMTNNPINDKEWSLFYKKDWDKEKYISSIRLDDIFTEDNKFFKRRFIEKNSNKEYFPNIQFKEFLDDITLISKPAYFAISTDGKKLKNLISNKFFTEVLINHLIENQIPLSIMLGVKRDVNKSFELGGDGFGSDGLNELEIIASRHGKLKLLVTHLSNRHQHQITILSRKFSNIKLFGFWWFNNQPSLIKKDLEMRFDLLGQEQILQHSDSRVQEQLIFKWIHFKKILIEELVNRYFNLIENKWIINEPKLAEDINNILYNNPKNYLNL